MKCRRSGVWCPVSDVGVTLARRMGGGHVASEAETLCVVSDEEIQGRRVSLVPLGVQHADELAACWRTRSCATRSGSAMLRACAGASRRGSRDGLLTAMTLAELGRARARRRTGARLGAGD